MSLHDLRRLERAFQGAEPLLLQGRVLRVAGLIVEATLPAVPVGTGCEIEAAGGRRVLAEVVGFNGTTALLVPFGELHGISSGAAVVPRASATEIPVGDELLGRVVDPSSRPVDGGPLPLLRSRAPLNAPPPPAMARRRIARPAGLGVKAIDALLTLGEGQRVGILAGPGVGKSVLLGMVARHADADVIVVGLIGERGREVREFVERDLGPGLSRSVVVVATADEPPLVRIRAALAATAVAEHFRARGKRVLLLLDSLTRVAMAQREIGLAAGEPPATKGYPPSVFAMLPRILERAGNDAGDGSVTGLYTVLAAGDDLTDPVVDCATAALDGHIVLSRRLASAGHFPAIDVLQSVSRVMTDVAPPAHVELAVTARELLASYDEAKDLIEVGAYVAGSNPRTDRAIACAPGLRDFLRQPSEQKVPPAQALELLKRAVKP
ncbi:MAG TPA: FliI/YscN family ATPase [Myxococcales bacterium]|jgi:flagellum-specific ATP synthase|nr:FliI/YscN family ATPase [Myxococcales bacterium]